MTNINVLAPNADKEFSALVVEKLEQDSGLTICEIILEVCEECDISIDNPILKTLLSTPLTERLKQELIDSNLLPDPTMGNNLTQFI
jgi:hypothetical protein